MTTEKTTVYKDSLNGYKHYTVYVGNDCKGMFLGDEEEFRRLTEGNDVEFVDGLTD